MSRRITIDLDNKVVMNGITFVQLVESAIPVSRTRKGWTPEEDAILISKKKAGMSSQEIGSALGRTPTSINSRYTFLESKKPKKS